MSFNLEIFNALAEEYANQVVEASETTPLVKTMADLTKVMAADERCVQSAQQSFCLTLDKVPEPVHSLIHKLAGIDAILQTISNNALWFELGRAYEKRISETGSLEKLLTKE